MAGVSDIEPPHAESIMRLSTLVIPHRTDALVTIATRMSALPLGVLTEARRAEIARNLIFPMLLLIDALQLVASGTGRRGGAHAVHRDRACTVRAGEAKRRFPAAVRDAARRAPAGRSCKLIQLQH